MTPEFSRPLPIESASLPRDVSVAASPAECAALAARFSLPDIQSLSCRFHLTDAPGELIAATGLLLAEITQVCVVTLEEFTATIHEQFAVNFVPSDQLTDDIDPEAIDEIPFENGVIDLGETAAEQLALSLDPYPHKPGAVLDEADDRTVGVEHPFAALSAWKRQS
jgi:uncharacterized metal-binding protein YceD (DUF177 family)